MHNIIRSENRRFLRRFSVILGIILFSVVENKLIIFSPLPEKLCPCSCWYLQLLLSGIMLKCGLVRIPELTAVFLRLKYFGIATELKKILEGLQPRCPEPDLMIVVFVENK